MYQELFGQMIRQLGQLDAWLTKAAAYATEKKIDPATILGYRLAADQLPLVVQVGIACDTAKLGASRLTGKDAPSHADNQTKFEELHARIQSVQEYLRGFSAGDFAESATRKISTPRWEGKTMVGADYFLQHTVPNFFFHVTHVYAILRHIGVPLGKSDYLGTLTMH
ncbi:MAG TPA: DUF1993 domain-containing protein [Kofleriaceae bacterium]